MGIGGLTAVATVVIVGSLGALLWIAPAAYGYLLMEDSPVEWLDFYCLVAAAAAFIAGARRRWRRPRVGVAVGVGLALFCLFVAGEEISWGQRIFRFRPLGFFQYRNIQGEVTVHNLDVGWIQPRMVAIAFMIGYGVLLPLAGRRTAGRVGIPVPPIGALPAFCIAAWLFTNPITQTDDEVGELVFAAAMLGSGLQAWNTRAGGRVMAQLLPMLLLLAVLTSWASYQSFEERDHARFVGPMQAGQAYEGIGKLRQAAVEYEKLARYWGSDWELWVKVVTLYRDARCHQKAYDLAAELILIHRREPRIWAALIDMADSLGIRDDAMARIREQYEALMREETRTHHDEKDRAFLERLVGDLGRSRDGEDRH